MLQRKALIIVSLIALALAVLMMVLPTPPTATALAGDDTLVIDNARYFDGLHMHEAAAITIEEARVLRIDEPGGGPADVNRIDATGKTLLPGLIDAHVHSFASARRDALPFGVTTLVDMFTSPSLIETARADRESLAPSDEAALYSAGMLATVEGGHGTQYGLEVETLDGPEDAQGWVATRLAEGSDFIKLVYIPNAPTLPSLDLATATAVIKAAHEAGVLAVAHVSTLEGARQMLDAGIDGLVHVFADRHADDAFVNRAAERGLFVIPTLAVIAMAAGQSTGPELIDDPHIGPRLTRAAATNLRQDFGQRTSVFRLDIALENVRRLHEAGVPILAGSDAPNPGTAHGATLHAELLLLVQAGLSETEALAAATSVPARYFELGDRGRVQPGSRADLLLVSGQPDQDIKATRAFDMIFRNGRPIEPAANEDTKKLALAGVLADFEEGVLATDGLVWSSTSDAMMGGSSEAAIDSIARDDGGTALAITASVREAFSFPWAGAYLGPAAEGAVGDFGSARAIAFDVRGTPASYRLMLFVSGGMGAPPTANFEADSDWRRVEIPLSAVTGFETDRFAGMAFVTPMRSGEYEFQIDNVALLP